MKIPLHPATMLRGLAASSRIAVLAVAVTVGIGIARHIDATPRRPTVDSVRSTGKFVSDANLDLVVARVVEVSDRNATIQNPPHVTLDFERVFRGRPHLGRTKALWSAESGWPPFRCGNETAEERRETQRYYSTAVRGPRVGTRMLLSGWWRTGDSLWVSTSDVRLRESPELWQAVIHEVMRSDSSKG